MSDLQDRFPGLSRINASGSVSAAQSTNAIIAMDEDHWITLSGKDKDGGKHWYKDGGVFWTPKGQRKAAEIIGRKRQQPG